MVICRGSGAAEDADAPDVSYTLFKLYTVIIVERTCNTAPTMAESAYHWHSEGKPLSTLGGAAQASSGEIGSETGCISS